MRLKHFSRPASAISGFTLMEMVMAMFGVGILGVTIAVFGFSSSRFIAKNLATNHTSQTTRISALSLLKEARDSAGAFTLATYNGTTFVPTQTPSASADTDALTGSKATQRFNAFYFRQQIGGPVKLAASISGRPTSITLTFSAGSVIPLVNDLVELPLIDETYRITGISGSGTNRTLTLNSTVDYTLDATIPNFVTARIYRRVGYSVFQNQLRFHSNLNALPGATSIPAGSYTVIRNNMTSPLPFAGLVDDGETLYNLRASLEITDLGYSSRKFRNGTTTLSTVIPVRNRLARISEPTN